LADRGLLAVRNSQQSFVFFPADHREISNRPEPTKCVQSPDVVHEHIARPIVPAVERARGPARLPACGSVQFGTDRTG
jgi:hypothetical protein